MSRASHTAEQPLAGVRVLIARASDQAAALADRIRALGGEPVEAPTIQIVAGDRSALRRAVRELADGRFIAVAFTSANGVAAVAQELAEEGLDPRMLAGTTVAAVGPGTARALHERLGVRPDLMPERATTAALGACFPPGAGRVLLPRADLASAQLPGLLRARGYEPVIVDAYATTLPARLPPGVADQLAAGMVDLLAFTSSSTVRNFLRLVGDRPWSGRIVSIGPVTTATCRQLGLEVAVEAGRHDLDGLVAALVRAVRPT
ncbi:MAG TPA: uroporphyrinogen-III synthase [Nitriliruptorales bacterium]|nr:uroporphyrinogen-III synthase [Nitriliruptorales bacterium]